MNLMPRAKALLFVGCAVLLASVPESALAQQSSPTAAASVQHGIDLVETGHCQEALPLLKHGLPHVTDKAMRYHGRMAVVRCAMAIDDERTATDTLLTMEQESPDDPEVLYIATHFFSELGMRAAQRLQARAPDSYQMKRLQAETLQSQGKNDQAAAIYQEILKKHPKVSGIHYKLGQIALAEAGASGSTDAAKHEFEQETEVDPTNASAEFVLGELDRRSGEFTDAVRHFTRATKLDVGFSEAYLALGMSLAASGKFAEAKAPLEAYVKMEPNDPAGHYQLAIAYARTGDKEEAAREMALQVKTTRAEGLVNTSQGHSVQP
ncbi:MAG: tetratricopeptide repeat protein [Acidobacteriaceae bacterium]